MVGYLIEMFVVSLLLTLVIEMFVAHISGIAFGKNALPVLLVNVLTNPVVVLLCWLWKIYCPGIHVYWMQIPLEGIVVWVEFWIYKSLAESGWCCKMPFRLSLTANGISWLVGVIISIIR